MNLVYYLLAGVAGAGLTLQVGLNGKLRDSLGTPVLASCISFTVGSLGLAIAFAATVLIGTQSVPAAAGIRDSRWWMWLGGLLGAFYVLTSVLAAPRIGFANTLSLVIAGQILLALLFDQFGALGNPVHAINPWRAGGALLLVAGVYLIQTH